MFRDRRRLAERARSTNQFNMKAARRQRTEQDGLVPCLLKPHRPIRSFQDNHLAIVDRRNIRPRLCGQQRECFAAFWHRTPKAGEAEPVFPDLGEFPFGFGRFGAGELEEMRCRHKAPAGWKTPTLRAEIDDGRSLRPRRGEPPTQFDKLVRSVFEPADDGSFVGRPDVFTRLEIWSGAREPHGYANFAERCEIVAVGDVVAEVVAHGRASFSPVAGRITAHADRWFVLPLTQITTCLSKPSGVHSA
jgi:hypothetical protein